jgi:hypothetical protein
MMQRRTGLIFSIYFSVLLLVSLLLPLSSEAQFLMDILDTTKELGKNSYRTLDRYNHIRISGYLQPQFQVASSKGAKTYSGGDFAENSDNRFMLRRGRIRFDYARTDDQNRNKLQFVFQFDGSERGVFIRDFWGRYWENKWQVLSVTTGMFARPFGFEVNLSSADREAPERGRMSQILMRTERDLGVMVTLENRGSGEAWKFFRLEGGFFNGQGLTGPQEYDSYKDFIGQLAIKPVKLGGRFHLSGGLQVFRGGLVKNAKTHFRMNEKAGLPVFEADSLSIRQGGKLPRRYSGVNAQLRYRSGWGTTEIRGEYWRGTQSATQQSSETPGVLTLLPDGSYEPLFIRQFYGGFFYFLQHIVNEKHQLVVKFDWYDPNSKASGRQIGSIGTNLNEADIRFNTLGLGYVHYLNDNLKIVLYHEWIRNESTLLTGYQQDKPDNVFTLRTQLRF